MNMIDFSIILPVYNQADHIATIVSEYLEVLEASKYTFEIILVVNNSRDVSKDICEQLAKDNENLYTKYLELGGWGRAVKAGLRDARGQIVAYANSARTNPQDLLLLLIYGAVNQDSVIKANRRVRDNLFRRLGSLLYNLECRMLFDLAYWDINGTPKVFPNTFGELFELTRDDDLIDLEFIITCRKNTYPVLEVPIFQEHRHGGKSTTNICSALKMYSQSFIMWENSRKDLS